MSATTTPTPGAAPATALRWTRRSCNYDHTSQSEALMTVCAACLTPKAPPRRRSVSFSDVETATLSSPPPTRPDAERRGMRVKLARDDVDWAKVRRAGGH